VKTLEPSSTPTPFLVRPRWPYDRVHVSEQAYRCLVTAQDILAGHGLLLVLTRGYERRGPIIRMTHTLARIVGRILFCLVYPHRSREGRAIFSPNGHDRLGDSVDVSIIRNGIALNLLPLGVFTPRWMIHKARQTHDGDLTLTWRALKTAGFIVHANATEAMQIHCEVRE
jgi:hypothetical protein